MKTYRELLAEQEERRPRCSRCSASPTYEIITRWYWEPACDDHMGEVFDEIYAGMTIIELRKLRKSA